MDIPSLVPSATTIIEAVLVLVAILVGLSGVRYISNDRAGIVEKRWSRKGSVKKGFIALEGEAGFQPELLRGGLHYLLPFQYKVHKVELVTVSQGGIGYVFARDGAPLEAAQALASNATVKDFQDARGFLKGGGQKGPQRLVLREGTYAINLALFIVLTPESEYYLELESTDTTMIKSMNERIEERKGFAPFILRIQDEIGIVVVHDGPSLGQGDIIAPTVGNNPGEENYHNNFQNADLFLAAGGRRGRQLQVLVEGTYYINCLFATVETVSKTVVEVGSVGVVVSFTGDSGTDTSGVEYRHGELVEGGARGVWERPLLPGKYPWNTYAGKVLMVPTTNFILKWVSGVSGNHKFDENLAEVSLITQDAFEVSLPLSVVVHIDYQKASRVIQRFGDIRKLVEQTLDPMVSAYFKNLGQKRTLIQLLQSRSEIQDAAGAEMRTRFAAYNLDLEEVLLGTPSATAGNKTEEILAQLRDRQIADERAVTYDRQQAAAVKERELREAQTIAQQQTALTQSAIAVEVQANAGKARTAQAIQEALQIETLAKATAEQTRLLGIGEAGRIRALAEAEAERAARVGVAQALAIEEQVRAYGGPQYQLIQDVMGRLADALKTSGVDVVPKISMGGAAGTPGTGGFAGGGLVENLLALLLTDKVAAMGISAPTAASAEAQAMRDNLLRMLSSPKAPAVAEGSTETS